MSEVQYGMNRFQYDWIKGVRRKEAERDFTEFWLWSCAEGYNIYKKDLKIAWERYANSDFGISRGIKERYYNANDTIARDVLNQYIIEQVGDSRKA